MRYRLLGGVSAVILATSMSGNAAAQSAAADNDVPVIVTGQRAQQIRAIEARRDALGVVDVASSDELGQLPDRNIAEVIERLPGLGVQYDQGEGRYVSIRGIPSELNGYTLNGFEIGNPDGTTRALPLDIISGQLLNSVEVFKVRTPDMTGQGIGGVINLVQQTAFDFREPFIIAASGQIGFQELRDGDHPVQADISVGGRFGQDEEFGILLGASYQDRTFTSYGLYPDDWEENDDAARGAVPSNIKYTDYRLKRERIGLTGSLDWRGGSTELFLRGLYSSFAEDEYRQRFRLDIGDPVFNADGVTGIATDTEQRSDLRLEQKDKSVLSIMTGGKTEMEDWTVDFGVAYTHNEVDEPNQYWQFRGDPGELEFDFTDKLYTVTPVDGYLAPSDLGFRSHSRQNEQGREDNYQGRIDVSRRFDTGGGESFIRFGANVRSTDKTFDAENVAYSRNASPDRFTLDGLAGENLTVNPGRDYFIAPVIDEDLIVDFTDANLNGPLFVLDEGGTLEDGTLNDLSLTEEVYAGYAMANLEFGHVGLTAGVRIERTELGITGYQLENETDVVPVSLDNGYTNILPTAILRFKPSDDTIIRLAYSRSVGRPEYSALSPGGSVSYELVGADIYEGSVGYGNANLKPYLADSLDAAVEYYFGEGGVVTVGGFAKFIKDPIFTQVDVLTDTSFGGRQYDRLEVSQPQNAESGEIFGLEFGYRQQFTFLPGLLAGLGVNLNATLIDASIEVPNRGETKFPEQSDLLWGAQLFFQQGPVEASVGYHHTGRALIGISGDEVTDEYNDDFRRLDAKIAFDITENIRVFAEGQNLTDEPTRQYQGGVRNWVIQNERYGRTYWVGAALRW